MKKKKKNFFFFFFWGGGGGPGVGLGVRVDVNEELTFENDTNLCLSNFRPCNYHEMSRMWLVNKITLTQFVVVPRFT